MGNMLDQVRNLSRLEYLGVSSFDQLLRYNFIERLPRLSRVCLSSYFMDATQLERFLMEVLPPLDYLELSALQLSDDLMQKCSEKFKQMVIFGAPDLPHNKRQHLLPKFSVVV